MKELLWVGCGGFVGSVLRFGVSQWMAPWTLTALFPLPTLVVNGVGSFLIGFWGGCNLSSGLRLMLITGVCGGFTTFSTFSAEAVRLLRSNHTTLALIYILCSVLLSLLGVVAGGYVGMKYQTLK